MNIVIGTIVFLYGLVFGSFFNVVGYRIPMNLSILKPGSFCPNCKHELKWYELIPLFSYIIQGGKCRKCKKKISAYYPFIETLTGILFVLSYILFGITPNFVVSCLISSFLVIIIVSDGRYMVIPDEVTLVFSILIIICNFIYLGVKEAITLMISGALLVLVIYIFMLICNKVFKKETLGGGDVKLMFFIGNVIGFPNSLFSIFIASLIALPVTIFLNKAKKQKEFPFGPFLLAGTLITYMLSINIIEILIRM